MPTPSQKQLIASENVESVLEAIGKSYMAMSYADFCKTLGIRDCSESQAMYRQFSMLKDMISILKPHNVAKLIGDNAVCFAPQYTHPTKPIREQFLGVIAALNSAKPNDRSNLDRHMAVTITITEDALARYIAFCERELGVTR